MSGAAGGARIPATPITDQAGAIAAMTQDPAYSLPSDPFLASGAAGGARLPATQTVSEIDANDPNFRYRDQFMEDLRGLPQDIKDRFSEIKESPLGQGVSNFKNYLMDKGGQQIADNVIKIGNTTIDVAKSLKSGAISLIGSALTGIPGLGLLIGALEETPEDAWNKQFAVGGEGFEELTSGDPEFARRLEGYSSDLSAGNIGGKDPFGRNIVSLAGNYEKALAEDLKYTGDSKFNKDKKAWAKAYFDKKGIADNPNEAKAFEEKYGITLDGTPVGRKQGMEDLGEIYSNIGRTRDQDIEDIEDITDFPPRKKPEVIGPHGTLASETWNKLDTSEVDISDDYFDNVTDVGNPFGYEDPKTLATDKWNTGAFTDYDIDVPTTTEYSTTRPPGIDAVAPSDFGDDVDFEQDFVGTTPTVTTPTYTQPRGGGADVMDVPTP